MTSEAAVGRPKKGDIVWLDFDMEVEGVEGVFDTTRRETAEKSGLLDPQVVYKPVIALIGAGRLVPGLDDAIMNTEPGQEHRVQLDVDKAFGPRDPKLIEVVPAQEFKKAKVAAEVGKRITYKNRTATVQRAQGGRVWLDMNSSLAGKKVTYTFKVSKVAATPEEKAEAMVRMHYDPNQEFKVTYHEEENTVDVQPPAPALYDERWLMAKFRVVNDFIRHSDFDRVRFVEEFATKIPKEIEVPAAPEGEGKTASQPVGSSSRGRGVHEEAEKTA